ncbi:conjugal transfer protein [Streptomyces sp. NBC_01381]|uniref:conjugal transfer protein n=1 Tax=Streptomyces sp. NBC_01381 TaxID=2903845 RepID=UPI002251B3BE|nr:conjugal transfer protein [Streptomyces sp. NBC_01381]MCX4673672.1 conjugal transfer protein [Streptomyces sp. NBC_01381]
MRAAWRKAPAPADAYEDQPPEFEEGGAEAEAGWVTVSSGAAANLTALVRWTAWALLIAGPALGLYALAQPSTAVGAPQPRATAPAVVRDAAGPAGFAELYVAAYARAGQGSEASLQPYFPGVRDVVLDAKPGAQRAERLATVRVREVSDGYWSVTVAAHLTGTKGPAKKDDSPDATDAAAGEVLRYFQVAVRSAGPGGAYIAAGLPAEVAAPEPGEAPELGYGHPVPADENEAASATVGEFLAAYLSGTGELDRYLSPGTNLSAISPAPYEQIKLTQLAERGGQFQPNADVSEGARRELLVDLEATDRAGQTRPLTYALALQARDGRWEISALDAAPALGNSQKGHN